MKIKSLFVAALVVISSFASAAVKEEPGKTGFAVIPVKGTEVFKVIYKGVAAGKVKLNIYNAAGESIYSETIGTYDGFICPVNFKGLAYGEYTIEVVDAAGKKIEKVIYQSARVQSSVSQVRVTKLSAPGKYLLAINNNAVQKINVKIFDANDNLVYNENREITGDFAQVYKFENETGSYSFQVTDLNGNVKTIRF